MGDSTVTVIASFKVKAGTEEEAKAALLAAVAPTLTEPGCLAYDLHQSTREPTQFMFYERWQDRAALDVHSTSTAQHRQELRQQLGRMVDGPPSVTIWQRVE
jgi:quinol monooxygenase YgiN